MEIETLTKKELKQLTLDDLKRSGLNGKDFTKMKLQPCNADQAATVLDNEYVSHGYIIPYFKVDGSLATFFRFKTLSNDEDQPKYLQLKNSNSNLYFPPNINWKKLLAKKGASIVITEGEKKAYAASEAGIPTIGLSGVWAFKSKRLQRILLDDFDLIGLADKKIILCFDNDAHKNNNVMQALQALASELIREKAKVKIKYLPEDDYEKIGLDDYLLEHTKEEFEDLPEINPLHKDIAELNSELAVLPVGSKIAVLREEEDLNYRGRKTISFYSEQNLRTLYANRKIAVAGADGQPREVPLFKQWLENPARRTYKGIIFDPEQDRDGFYNLWTGFEYEPRKGSCKRYKKHLLDNIANGNKKVFDYIWAWMADAVQNPSDRKGVSIVLRGEQGTGKGVFINNFGKLFGKHYAQVSTAKNITGNFNSMLKDKMIMFIDEGFWAGDRSMEGTLKGLITEDTIWIEPKNIDKFEIRNHLRILMASNHDWVTPAGFGERRMCVLDVSESKKQNSKYFNAITKEMKNGGREALLYELLHYDLTGIDLRDFPKTEALLEQKINTMGTVQKFWFHVLENADLLNGQWNSGEIPSKTLYDNYIAFSKDIGSHYNEPPTTFGRSLRKLCNGIRKKQKKSTISKNDKVIKFYVFPDIEKCREDFEKAIGSEINWEDLS